MTAPALVFQRWLLCVVSLAALAPPLVCDAMKTSGSLVLKANSTVFLSKFCFTFNPKHPHTSGFLDVRVWHPAELGRHRIRMVLYDDEEHSYTGPSKTWGSLSCDERIGHGVESEVIDGHNASTPEGGFYRFKIKQKVRPRWWYVALTDCSGAGGELPIVYDLHMTNPAYGWGKEFSTDRRFLPQLFSVFVVAYAALSLAQLHANRANADQAKDDSPSNKAAHPFVRILTWGVLLGLAECSISLLHTCIFAHNGRGFVCLQVLAQLLSVTTNFVLASLLLLVSQGKCISYIMVYSDVWKMLRLLGPFLVSCCMLELWGEYSVAQNYTTNSVYTTPAGWVLIAVDLLLLAMFVSGLRRTHRTEPDEDTARFYRRWGSVYGLWFVVLPVTALLSQMVLAPYAWLMVSTGAKKAVTALLYAALVAGLWPGNTRTFFTKLEMPERQPTQVLLGRHRLRHPELASPFHTGRKERAPMASP